MKNPFRESVETKPTAVPSFAVGIMGTAQETVQDFEDYPHFAVGINDRSHPPSPYEIATEGLTGAPKEPTDRLTEEEWEKHTRFSGALTSTQADHQNDADISRQQFNKTKFKLNEEDKHNLRAYTTHSSYINGHLYLRQSKFFGGMKNEKFGADKHGYENFADRIQTALNKYPAAHKDFTIFAGVRRPSDPEEVVKFSGGLHHLPSFQSASTMTDVALKFADLHDNKFYGENKHLIHSHGNQKELRSKMAELPQERRIKDIVRFNVKKGQHVGAYIKHFSKFDDEKEFLVSHNQHVMIHPEPTVMPIENHPRYGNFTARVWDAHFPTDDEVKAHIEKHGDNAKLMADSKDAFRSEPQGILGKIKSKLFEGYDRDDMPQIEDVNAFKNDMANCGHECAEESVNPEDLEATQSEFNSDKVESMRGKPKGTIIITKDNKILDGHHRWLAAHKDGESINAMRIDMDADDAIGMLNNRYYTSNKSVNESFEDYLFEELNYNQKEFANRLYRGDHSFSDHVFNAEDNNGLEHTDRHIIPLLDPEGATAVPSNRVMQHLHTHGFKVTDYQGGYAEKHEGDDKRSVKIGKILHRTNAPLDLKQEFENDPARKGVRNTISGMQVVISRHRHDVVGMSTGRGWKSCQALKANGKPEHSSLNQLHRDLQAGTHVAYLTKVGDDKAENPKSRIALRAYESHSGHKIIRPSSAEYGTGGDAFRHTVRHFTESHFPAVDLLYNHSGGYRDSGDGEAIMPTHISDAMAKHAMKSGHAHNLVRHPNLTPKIINKLLDHDDQTTARMAAQHPNASVRNLTKAYGKGFIKEAINHEKTPNSLLSKATDDGYHLAVFTRKGTPESIRTTALNKIESSFGNNSHVDSRTLGVLGSSLKDKRGWYQQEHDMSMKPKHLAKLHEIANRFVNHSDSSFYDNALTLHRNVMNHPNTPADVINDHYNKTADVYKNSTDKHNKYNNESMFESTINHPNLSADSISHFYHNVLQDRDDNNIPSHTHEIGEALLEHKNTPKSVIEHVLANKTHDGAYAAALTSTKVHKSKIIEAIKTHGAYHFDYRKPIAGGKLNHNDVTNIVAHQVANPINQGFRKLHNAEDLMHNNIHPISEFLKSTHPDVRAAVFAYRNAHKLTRDDIKAGMKDGDHNVARAAKLVKNDVYKRTRGD